MSERPNKYDDVIDSRDVIEAIAEIESELECMRASGERTDLVEELAQLTELAEQASGSASDWKYGATLVRDSYFEEYAREMVEDCGYFNTDRSPHSTHGETYAPDFNTWPYRCIDWEQVADELKQDYTSVDFDGVTYWVR